MWVFHEAFQETGYIFPQWLWGSYYRLQEPPVRTKNTSSEEEKRSAPFGFVSLPYSSYMHAGLQAHLRDICQTDSDWCITMAP